MIDKSVTAMSPGLFGTLLALLLCHSTTGFLRLQGGLGTSIHRLKSQLRLSNDSGEPAIRIGHGWDIHRLAEGLPLVIGGVKLQHTHGAEAHRLDYESHSIITDPFRTILMMKVESQPPSNFLMISSLYMMSFLI